MILLDDRAGSKDFKPLLPKDTQLTRLQYGDVAFVGNGPDNKPYMVGVELKQVSDALNSMTTGRFAGHQLIGMLEEYDISYLLVFGAYRACPKSGILQFPRKRGWSDARIGRRRFMWRDFETWLITLETKTALKVRKARDKREAAHLIKTLHSWWTSKDYEKHRSHLALHEARESVSLVKPSLLRKVSACLPGIGWDRSRSVEKHFGSVFEMVVADEKEWLKVDGIGKGIAKKVVKEMGG